MEKRKVLIVDDTPTEIHLLLENLKHDYAVQVATSGEKALALLDAGFAPDVILMDAIMPVLDGYDTCRRIKACNAYPPCDVIFVSAHDTTEEMLAGYDAGGSDYLIKPISPDELQQKVKVALRNKDQRDRLNIEIESAVETAVSALSSSGEQGVVIDFLRGCFPGLSADALAHLLIRSLARLSLSSSVQLRSTLGVVEHSDNGSTFLPVENDLIQRSKGQGKFIEHKHHLIVTLGPVSLLIRGLPAEGERKSRLKESIAVMIDGAVAKLHQIELQSELAANKALLKPYIRAQRQTFEAMITAQKQQKENTMAIMDRLMEYVEANFMALGLTENQERALMSILQPAMDEMLANFEEGTRTDERLSALFEELKHYAS